MKRVFITSEQWKCILFIILLFFGFLIPNWWDWLNSGKITVLDFEYDSDCLLGLDTSVEGLEVYIYLDDVSQGMQLTNALGQITYVSREAGNYTFKYYWKHVISEAIDMSELVSETLDIEIDSHSIEPFVYFSDTLDVVSDRELDLLYWDGSSWATLTTITTDGFGQVPLTDGLFVGEFMFEGQNDTFDITSSKYEPVVSEIYISPIEIMISIIINQKPVRIIISFRHHLTPKFFLFFVIPGGIYYER